MAHFNCEFSDDSGGYFTGDKDHEDALGIDDLLEVLRPAALRLRDLYKEKLSSLGFRQTGALIDSIDIEDNDIIK